MSHKLLELECLDLLWRELVLQGNRWNAEIVRSSLVGGILGSRPSDPGSCPGGGAKADSSVEEWDTYTRALQLAWQADEVCGRTFERAKDIPTISFGDGYPSIKFILSSLAETAVQAAVT